MEAFSTATLCCLHQAAPGHGTLASHDGTHDFLQGHLPARQLRGEQKRRCRGAWVQIAKDAARRCCTPSCTHDYAAPALCGAKHCCILLPMHCLGTTSLTQALTPCRQPLSPDRGQPKEVWAHSAGQGLGRCQQLQQLLWPRWAGPPTWQPLLPAGPTTAAARPEQGGQAPAGGLSTGHACSAGHEVRPSQGMGSTTVRRHYVGCSRVSLRCVVRPVSCTAQAEPTGGLKSRSLYLHRQVLSRSIIQKCA